MADGTDNTGTTTDNSDGTRTRATHLPNGQMFVITQRQTGSSLNPVWSDDTSTGHYVNADGSSAAGMSGNKTIHMSGPQGAGWYVVSFVDNKPVMGDDGKPALQFLGEDAKATNGGDVKSVGGILYQVTKDAQGKETATPLTTGNNATIKADADRSRAESAALAAQAKVTTAAATTTKATAYAGLTQAKIDQMKEAGWASVQPTLDEIDRLHQAGQLTDDQAQMAKGAVMNKAMQEQVTGISEAQRQKNALTAQGQAVEQGDNRATNAANIFNDSFKDASSMATTAMGNGGAIARGLQAMLQSAPGFQDSMGGSSVQIGQGLTPQQSTAMSMLQGLMGKGMNMADAANAVTSHLTGTPSPGVNGPLPGDPNPLTGYGSSPGVDGPLPGDPSPLTGYGRPKPQADPATAQAPITNTSPIIDTSQAY